jgi:beta-1,4-mannosyl-glycoprotein beta-1,4-N-acetylglucosaminyltransferase
MTFQGNPKPLYFDEHRARFAPLLPKIIHIVIDDITSVKGDTWAKENFMRRAIYRGMSQQLRIGDIVIVGDVDEIVRPEILYSLKACEGYDGTKITFYSKNYYYAYSVRDVTDKPASIWPHPDGSVYKGTDIDLQMLRIEKRVKRTFDINDAGWHCSFFFPTLSQMRNKLHSTPHVEFSTPQILNRSNIVNSVRYAIDILRRTDIYFQYEDPVDIPMYLYQHMPRFEYLLDRRGPTAMFRDF